VKNAKIGLARQEFNRIISVLKKNGYKDTMSLFDFWDERKILLHPKIYGDSVSDDTFALQIRWYSKQKAEEATRIRNYIRKKVHDNNQIANEQQKTSKVTIDFADINPPLELYPIKNEDEEGNFNLFNLVDLRGISLMELNLSSCEFKNCCFNAAFLDFSNLVNVTFTDCTFFRTSFYKSDLMAVTLLGITTWSGIYVDGAYLSQIRSLDDDRLPYPFIATEITYFQILQQLFNKLIYNDFKFKDNFLKHGFTVYSDMPVEGLKNPDVKELKEYITWFQSWSRKLLDFKSLRLSRKIEFLVALVLTKYWSSATAFAGVIFFIDFIFSCIFFASSDSFNNLTIPDNPGATFIKSFYYSTVTLLTLGYGDVFPKFWGGQIIVTGEVFIGYVLLGLFLYLISRRVERLY